MTNNDLTRYAYWELRDFLREKAIALLLVGGLLGFMTVAPMRSMMMGNIDEPNARRILLMLLPQIVFISAFIVFNGLISTDRTRGYYRFLFSKPVSIPAYYAQHFVVYLVGFLAVFAVLLTAFALAMKPVNPVGTIVYCALVYLSLGGIAFFVSSLFRYDWSILAAIYLGSALLNTLWADRGGWRMAVRNLLPPMHKLNPAMNDLINGTPVEWSSIAWLLGYSAIFFIAGLIVLWRRPIG